MKFNSYLKSHRVPEWRSAYVDYRLLKKLLKRAAQQEGKEDGSGSTDQPTDSDQHDADTSDVEATAGQRPTLVESPSSVKYPSRDLTSEPDTINPKLDVRTQASMGRRPSGASRTSSRRSSASWRDQITPTKRSLPGSISRFGGWRYPPSWPLQRILPLLNEAERKFFTQLVRELDKVNSFYKEREARAVDRFREIGEQLQTLDRARKMLERNPPSHMPRVVKLAVPQAVATGVQRVKSHIAGEASSDGEIEGRSTFRRTKNALGEQSLDEMEDLVHNLRPETHLRAKKALKAAIFEEYRFLDMLKSYRTLNRTAFSKACKKCEKQTRIPCSSSFMERVNASAFVASTQLDELTAKAEKMFADYFEGGSRKKALTRLRMLGVKKTHHFAAGRAGFYIGLALPPFIDGLVKATRSDTQIRLPYWTALMQLYGALLLPVALACSFMLNLTVMHRSGVNFQLIFELDIRSMMAFQEYLELPAMLLCLLCYAFWLSFAVWPSAVSPFVWPLAWIVLVLVIFFNPLPIMHLHARYWLIGRVGRVFAFGLLPTQFTDFWLGDQLVSLYYLFYNFGFLVCLYHRQFVDTPPHCNTNSTWVSPLLASIPAFARLGQSIRRYVDSEGLPVHMLNAGKYAFNVIYFWMYFNWRIQGSNYDGTLGALIPIAVINSLCSLAWDLLLDWNLLKLHSRHRLLRNELVYKNREWCYYAAIITDCLLRFSWVIYLAPSPSVQLRGFLVGMTEVFRRFVWNFFRLEAEQIGNADAYRVTRDVPLPFTVEKMKEEEEEAEGGVSGWALHPVARIGRSLRDWQRGSRDEPSPPQTSLEGQRPPPATPKSGKMISPFRADSSASDTGETDGSADERQREHAV